MHIAQTLPIQSQTKEMRLDGFSITIVEGQNAGTSLCPQKSEVSVGSFQGNDLVLVDPTVSRHHFSVTATPGGFLLRDLGSANGTWIGSVRVVTVYVESGVQIRAGRTILRIDHVDEDIREALSPEDRFGTLLGTSASIRRIFAALPRVAATDSTVLLAVERAIIFEDPALLALEQDTHTTDLTTTPPVHKQFDPLVPFRMAKQKAANQWEKEWLKELIVFANNNISEAARIAKMDRSHLHELVRKYDLRATETENEP